MNFTEQKNYLIAGIVSLTVHFFLLMIYLPGLLASETSQLETFPVGLVEISSGTPARGSLSQPQDKIDQSIMLKSPESRQPNQGKTEVKPNINPHQSPENASVVPKQERIAVSGHSKEKLENQIPGDGKRKLETQTNKSSKVTAMPPKKQVPASYNPLEKYGGQSVPGENVEEIPGSENPSLHKPQSFGTGKAMVTVQGAMPIYPPDALKEGKEGDVAIRIFVNGDGGLDVPIITQSSGDIRLDYAATSSVERNWKFSVIFEGYYIDLLFSFRLQTGVSVKFLKSKTR
jgi:TonB family protein